MHETGSSENQHYVTNERRHQENGCETALRTCRIAKRQQQQVVDNSWVIPYCLALSRMFSYHINADLCISGTAGTKYHFMYIFKGHDHVTMEYIRGEESYDEIYNFRGECSAFTWSIVMHPSCV